MEFTLSPEARPKRPYVDQDVEIERLRDACAMYHRQYEFTIGDLICLKRGIQIVSNQSGSEGVYVVLDTFPDSYVLDDPTDMVHYGVRYDLYLGMYDEDGDFLIGPHDSRRFEPWPRPAE